MNTQTLTTADKNMRLFNIAKDRAIENIGEAIFFFQPKVIQRALIAEEILTLVNAQDEDTSDARVREMTMALWQINGTW